MASRKNKRDRGVKARGSQWNSRIEGLSMHER
jgi:hypothetical protein